MVVFAPVNIQEISHRLRIVATAEERGAFNEPAADDVELDNPQKAIIHFIMDRLRAAREEGEKALNADAQRRKEIELDFKKTDYNGLPAQAVQDIHHLSAEMRDGLIGARKKERDTLGLLKLFRSRNGLLHRPAHYPESKILHWALIIVAIVTESIANSYFFAQGSDLGLLGGVFQALLISVANIGVALFVGVYALPYFNHVNQTRRQIAYGGVGGYSGLAFLFNLATAHYRAELEIDPLDALMNAIPRLIESPFGIDNFDAWVLFVIGLMFVAFALVKGYGSDDPYPGYGRIDRLYRRTQEAYAAEKQRYLARVKEIVDHRSRQLDEFVVRAHRNAQDYQSLLTRSESVAREFAGHARNLEQACIALLGRYRDANEGMRTDGLTPMSFHVSFTLPAAQRKISPGFEEESVIAEEIRSLIKDLDQKRNDIRSQLRAVHKDALHEAKTFFDEIEGEAARRQAEESARESAAKRKREKAASAGETGPESDPQPDPGPDPNESGGAP